jgi:hypothetical protein
MDVKRFRQEDKRCAHKPPAQTQPLSVVQTPESHSLAASVLRLQRSLGNSYVQQLLAGSTSCEAKANPEVQQRTGAQAQRKVTVSQPGDESELEAERVAEQIMRMPEPASSGAAPVSRQTVSPEIRRMCSECEEEVHREPTPVEPGAIRTTEGGHASEISPHIQAYLDHLPNEGQSLPESVRSFFEPRFGQDFSQVRIHTDSDSARSARSLNARAFTLGRDIVFGNGEYTPDSREGKRLLAHELTHVVQQQGHHLQNLQRLTVTGIGAGTTGTCGAYRRRWDFELGSAAPADGYLVQKVDFTLATATCTEPVVNATPGTPTLTFWEAWRVQSGHRLFRQRTAVGYTDQSSFGSQSSTSGTVVAAGEIKFFTEAVTGNLGDLHVAGTAPGWAPGGEPQSGPLPSTHTEPTWWSGAPTEGPVSRSAQSLWNCCGDPSAQYSNTFFMP